MRKLMLLAGVAALGVSMPVLAKEQGRGGGRGQGQAAHGQKQGGGQASAERGRGRGEARAGHGRGHGQARAERRGGGHDVARGQGNRGPERRLNRDERRIERAIQQERRLVRQARRDDSRPERSLRGDERRLDRQVRIDRRDWRGWTDRRLARHDRFGGDPVRSHGRRLAVGSGGCPPGLARQNAFCMPPGQLRRARFIGQRLAFANLGYNVPERYRYRFIDDDRFFYRYGNDATVYRFDRSTRLVSSVIPLNSTGLFLGEPLPLGYEVYNVPFGYRNYYQDSDDYLYRYDSNAIYRVNTESMLIEGVVALLTGGTGGLGALGVGDQLPLGYDAYNVPFDHRDTYYDTDDSMYRYADGSIYQVDPQTRLIEAIISLLV
jgi:hypothetical protein